MGLELVTTAYLNAVRILSWLQFSSMCATLQLALDPVFGSCFSIWSPWPGDARVCVTLKSTIMISVAIT